ncbi:NAD-dependent deacetylase [Luminiphilus syltensis NOR5-1B]|uniref:protein acetyllysine N-acetyltransferase n=1 Tax=Luminiphilus syltensis NOR5-1B TaxID=565045 RepID=B8KQQ3_9GAMM|nr:NAD-dependent protein deacetylase [Luminiphilus syltensis]EED34572.1 NAD-dependent deacetylase [Luminiphilus syltensis NOR5-1B]
MPDLVAHFNDLLESHRRWTIITGAGVSADSGIPTYRDARGKWLGSNPIQHQEFLRDPGARRRYWSRSVRGWPGVRDAAPNPVHLALTRFEQLGHLELLITQNVDRLHQRAGTNKVVDLHGRLDRVICLHCGADESRERVQQRLERINPTHDWRPGTLRPDGDSELPGSVVEQIKITPCPHCEGVLMPDVVFFGGSVPRSRVQQCEQAIATSDAVLVLGSSLQVYSGYRFCKRAHQLEKPIVILNNGVTRADALATLKIPTNAMQTFINAVDTLMMQHADKRNLHG